MSTPPTQPENAPADDVRGETVNGVLWSIVNKVGGQVLSLGVVLVLARLLTPEDFGLLAMVTVVTGFAMRLAELGLGAALIHKPELTEEHLASAFWINTGLGAVLTITVAAAAPLIAALYDEPYLLWITLVTSANFLIRALGVVPDAMLRKTLDFRRIAIINIVSSGAAGVVAIIAALQGLGVWSLVIQFVLSASIATAMLWSGSAWYPRFQFDWDAAKDILPFGLNFAGTTTLNYWTRNLDNLLIGWKLGSAPLGLYSRAYSLLIVPLTNVTRVMAQVAFPSFSKIQTDTDRVRRGYLKASRLVALVTFPMMLGLAVTAEPFVLTVFGDQWVEMIPLVRVFGLAGVVESVTKLNGTLYLSQGKAGLQFKVGIMVKLMLIIGIVVGLQYGVYGIAVAYAVMTLVSSIPDLHYSGRLVGLSVWQFGLNIAPVLLCALAMAGVAAGVVSATGGMHHALQLGLSVLAGGVFYIALVHALGLMAYREVVDLTKEALSKRRRLHSVRT